MVSGVQQLEGGDESTEGDQMVPSTDTKKARIMKGWEDGKMCGEPGCSEGPFYNVQDYGNHIQKVHPKKKAEPEPQEPKRVSDKVEYAINQKEEFREILQQAGVDAKHGRDVVSRLFFSGNIDDFKRLWIILRDLKVPEITRRAVLMAWYREPWSHFRPDIGKLGVDEEPDSDDSTKTKKNRSGSSSSDDDDDDDEDEELKALEKMEKKAMITRMKELKLAKLEADIAEQKARADSVRYNAPSRGAGGYGGGEIPKVAIKRPMIIDTKPVLDEDGKTVYETMEQPLMLQTQWGLQPNPNLNNGGGQGGGWGPQNTLDLFKTMADLMNDKRGNGGSEESATIKKLEKMDEKITDYKDLALQYKERADKAESDAERKELYDVLSTLTNKLGEVKKEVDSVKGTSEFDRYVTLKEKAQKVGIESMPEDPQMTKVVKQLDLVKGKFDDVHATVNKLIDKIGPGIELLSSDTASGVIQRRKERRELAETSTDDISQTADAAERAAKKVGGKGGKKKTNEGEEPPPNRGNTPTA